MNTNVNWLEKLKNISVVITCLSLTIGVIVSVNTILQSARQSKMNSIEQSKNIIKEEYEVKEKIATFLLSYSKITLSEKLFTKYKTGRDIFFSKELKEYREICHHYELVGALVEAGYIDFDFYFEIVAFPDDFYKETIQLTNYIRNNWSGKDERQSDFLSNFENLRIRYSEKRNYAKVYQKYIK